MTRGLDIIATRSEGLSRFLGAYARLANCRDRVSNPLPSRVGSSESRRWNSVFPSYSKAVSRRTSRGDSDQLDQLLINLIRNAADASLETNGAVTLGWARGEPADLASTFWTRARSREHGQSVCAVLHDQARRVGNRIGVEPANRGGAWRESYPSESFGRTGMRGDSDIAVVAGVASTRPSPTEAPAANVRGGADCVVGGRCRTKPICCLGCAVVRRSSRRRSFCTLRRVSIAWK